ncbi:unnamed protein product [Ectocarpus sp. 6 AP-2014]
MRCGSTTATSGRGSLQHGGEQSHQRLTPTQFAVRNTRPGGATAWLVGPGIAPVREAAAAGTVGTTAPFAGGALRMMAESGAPPAKKGKGKGPYKVIATNKKARRNYEILEKFVAGIELVGSEVKSCRMSKINMDEGFAQAKKGQCFLHGIHIAECGVSNRFYQHEPRRPRRLLLHKREIKKLEDKVAQKGMTVVPLKIFFDDNNRLKVEIGLALGKNVRDKREDIKARDAKRDIQRISKNAY